ncbi:hypothetical protein ACIBL6_13450 [Streptomyces sp. NPDC050400]|uniref:hypothetical protein n=1 Tax=Streptomyces sp. NPDC050400 TaxID=3365610 RepID=UPI0037B01F69
MKRGGRVAAGVGVAVVVAVVVTGCGSGSDGSERQKAQMRSYCVALGDWQEARDEANGDTGVVNGAGDAALAAARHLDQSGLEPAGSDLLTDTSHAVNGDTTSEGRAVSSCDADGFETLVHQPS